VQRSTRVTILHVTHNLAEAEQLADMILHLQDGKVERRE
jgi:ABC-type molybdate transport system ATPase subunit